MESNSKRLLVKHEGKSIYVKIIIPRREAKIDTSNSEFAGSQYFVNILNANKLVFIVKQLLNFIYYILILLISNIIKITIRMEPNKTSSNPFFKTVNGGYGQSW